MVYIHPYKHHYVKTCTKNMLKNNIYLNLGIQKR